MLWPEVSRRVRHGPAGGAKHQAGRQAGRRAGARDPEALQPMWVLHAPATAVRPTRSAQQQPSSSPGQSETQTCPPSPPSRHQGSRACTCRLWHPGHHQHWCPAACSPQMWMSCCTWQRMAQLQHQGVRGTEGCAAVLPRQVLWAGTCARMVCASRCIAAASVQAWWGGACQAMLESRHKVPAFLGMARPMQCSHMCSTLQCSTACGASCAGYVLPKG